MILHTHNDETDYLDVKLPENEFISRNASRQNMFGRFETQS
jgi:hypothetical protein